MKLMSKLAALVCLSCTALHAAQFLVLIRSHSWNPQKYVRAEQSGGRFVVADTNTYTGSDIRFIIEDIWAGTPWLEGGEPFWIRSELNNKYWRAATDQKIRADRDAPTSAGTETFQLHWRLDYEGQNYVSPNPQIWYGNYLYGSHGFGYGVEFNYGAGDSDYFTFTILAVYE